MSGSMMNFVQRVKYYPGQQQVNLSVEIEVPGSWFGGTEMGSLSASERRQKQAVEYAEVREFPGASARARKLKEPAIRFICLDDASSDPRSDGYWMQLSQWNRFRHDTFKERPEDEMPFIMGTGPSSVLAAELDAGPLPAVPIRCRLPDQTGFHTHQRGCSRAERQEGDPVLLLDLHAEGLQVEGEADHENAQGYRPPLPPP